jgi:glutathione S-transferase
MWSIRPNSMAAQCRRWERARAGGAARRAPLYTREAVRPTLYVLAGSHPCVAVELMLRRKGLECSRVELPPVVSAAIVRAIGFPRRTVPALRLDGRRVQGSLSISRALEELQPEPPLFPGDPRVDEAERWGEQLQNVTRRIDLWGLLHDRSGVEAQLRGSSLPLPPALGAWMSGPSLRLLARINNITDEAVRRDLADLPSKLDHVDELLAEGVIDADEPNAAACQIAPSLRMLLTIEDLRPAIEGRPAGEFARRLVPDYAARISPGVFPPELVARVLAQARSSGAP